MRRTSSANYILVTVLIVYGFLPFKVIEGQKTVFDFLYSTVSLVLPIFTMDVYCGIT